MTHSPLQRVEASKALIRFDPAGFTSESDEVLSPTDLRLGYVIALNGQDYRFIGLNCQAIFVKAYSDPDLIGPPRPAREEGYYWSSVERLHVY